MSVEALRWEGPKYGVEGEGAVTDFGKKMQECMRGWDLRGDRKKIYESLETAPGEGP